MQADPPHILMDIAKLAKEVDEPLTYNRYKEEGGNYSREQIEKYYQSWQEALQATGVRLKLTPPHTKMHGREELREDVKQVGSRVNGLLGVEIYIQMGTYRISEYFEEYSSWTQAVLDAGIDFPHDHKRKPFKMINDVLWTHARARDNGESGDFSYEMYQDYNGGYNKKAFEVKFGSWETLLEEIGLG